MKENILFGTHAVKAVLEQHPERILRLILAVETKKDRRHDLVNLAQLHDISIEYWARDKMDREVGDKHQGVMAAVTLPKMGGEHDLDAILDASDTPFILILDGIQDPHNLGACLRTADAVGVDCVVIPKDKSVGLTPTVCKIASGAAETVPVIAATNLARVIRTLKDKGVWIYGTDDEAPSSLYQIDVRGPVAWILGAEGEGMRRLTKELCDVLVQIPMQGSVSSLNVSCANAVVLYETLRQRTLA